MGGIRVATTYDLVCDGGCVGDGVTDDTARFAAAIVAAGTARIIVSPPGRTYLISAGLVAPSGQRWQLNGATIKAAISFPALGKMVTAQGCPRLEGFVMNGNAGNGVRAFGLWATFAGNEIVAVTGRNLYYNAFSSALNSQVTFRGCNASSVNDGNGPSGTACGFGGQGLMIAYGCSAYDCARAGFFSDVGSPDGCHFDGTTRRCGYGVNVIGGNNGTVNVTADDSNVAGHRLVNVTGWTGTLKSRDVGRTSRHVGAGCELTNCTGLNLNIEAYRNPSYGVNLTGVTDSQIDVHLDARDHWNTSGDPGLHLGSGCLRNRLRGWIGYHSWGVILGEGLGENNNGNDIDVTAVGCSYGALILDRGANNILKITARDCATIDQTYNGLVTLWSANATNNRVTWLDVSCSADKPKYGVRFRDGAAGNMIVDGYLGANYVTAPYLDSDGTNSCTLR